MAKKIGPSGKINGYTVQRHIHTGQKALSYDATAADGTRVFLKQYRSPTPTVPWYAKYVEYEHEKRRRIEGDVARQFCVATLDIFEATHGHKCFFQAFEYVDCGDNLRVILEKLSKKAAPLTWRTRLTIGMVLTSAVGAIHRIGLVHGDLKPENVQLIEDPSIGAGYRTKLIDMDSSVLTDIEAPWHKHEGYVGTQNYHSPEHLGGKVPEPASDVFTCGLILYELLDGKHPYWLNDEEEYLAAIKANGAPLPALLGKLPGGPEATEVLRETMRCALSPSPRERPTAMDLNHALNGRLAAEGPRPSAPPVEPKREPVGNGSCLTMVGPNGVRLDCRISIDMTRALAKRFGEDAQYLSDPQFTLRRDLDATWTVVPNPCAQNETLLNGKPVIAPTALSSGDILGVGNASRGIVKLPVRLEIGIR